MSEKENFIQTIREDEYAEWELAEGLVLSTDVEFDGTFLPTIIDFEDRVGEEIEELMEENDVHDVFTWIELEYDEGNGCWYPIVEYCEYESIDHSVWE